MKNATSFFGRIQFLIFALGSFVITQTACQHDDFRKLELERKWAHSTSALWKIPLGPKGDHRSAPLVLPPMIYAGNGSTGMSAFEIDSGRMQWTVPVKNGVSAPATADNDRVYFGGGDGQFYAVNRLTGSILWTFPLRAELTSEPLIHEGVVYVLAAQNVFYAIEAQTGKQKWSYNRGDVNNFSIRGGTKPCVEKGFVFVGFPDGFLVSIKTSDGSVKWERQLSREGRFLDIDGSVVTNGKTLFTSSYDGSLYALNIEDGQILWKIDEGGYTAPALDENNLYYPTTSGQLLALDIQNGKTKWSIKSNRGILTQPILVNETLIYGEARGDLIAVNKVTGTKLSSFSPGRGIFSKPTYIKENSSVYFLSSEGNLFALQFQWQNPLKKMIAQPARQWKRIQ